MITAHKQPTSTNSVARFELIETRSARLQALEVEIATCEASYLIKGRALREIRDSRLYERSYGTGGWDRYCKARWGYSRKYANELIRASVRAEYLGTIVPVLPGSEHVSSMLAPLDGNWEQMGEVWRAVVDRIGAKNVAHSALVAKVVATFVAASAPAHIQPEAGSASENAHPLPVLVLDDLPPVLRECVLEHAATVRSENHRPPTFIPTENGTIIFGGAYANADGESFGYTRENVRQLISLIVAPIRRSAEGLLQEALAEVDNGY